MFRWCKILYLWRYWPLQVLYFPLTVYMLLIESLRTRRLFYFAAANPEISLGGFAGDSKFHIMQHVPQHLKPQTILIRRGDDFKVVENAIRYFTFPVVAKPDIGEGGFKVKIINNIYELIDYNLRNNMDYLIQSYSPEKHELTLLCYKQDDCYVVSSIVERLPFRVKGDGRSTIKQLMLQSDAGFYNQARLKKHFAEQLDKVPAIGEVVLAGNIGNWNYGATFIEQPQLNTPEVQNQITKIMSEIKIFNFARIDFKCDHYMDLMHGEIKILEINGVKGEPVQIYDGRYTLLKAYKIIFKQWRVVRQLSLLNIRNGFICPGVFKGFSILFKHAIHKLK